MKALQVIVAEPDMDDSAYKATRVVQMPYMVPFSTNTEKLRKKNRSAKALAV